MSLDLLDWRRRVHELYRAAREASVLDAVAAHAAFRAGRDRLFAEHPQSPIPPADRAAFTGLPYWPYDPSLRFDAPVEPDAPDEPDAPAAAGGHVAPIEPASPEAPRRLSALSLQDEAFPLERIGRVHLPVGDLEVYWIDVYGGGVFVPFRDATSGRETYGAGRYLLDTVKGADLGGGEGRLVLDFNYAYHPSCAYDPRWSCPLAPRANWLAVAIEAGERLRATR